MSPGYCRTTRSSSLAVIGRPVRFRHSSSTPTMNSARSRRSMCRCQSAGSTTREGRFTFIGGHRTPVLPGKSLGRTPYRESGRRPDQTDKPWVALAQPSFRLETWAPHEAPPMAVLRCSTRANMRHTSLGARGCIYAAICTADVRWRRDRHRQRRPGDRVVYRGVRRLWTGFSHGGHNPRRRDRFRFPSDEGVLSRGQFRLTGRTARRTPQIERPSGTARRASFVLRLVARPEGFEPPTY
jgi:hypothetical protein